MISTFATQKTLRTIDMSYVSFALARDCDECQVIHPFFGRVGGDGVCYESTRMSQEVSQRLVSGL